MLVIFALSRQSPSSCSAKHGHARAADRCSSPSGSARSARPRWAPAPLVERRKVSDDAVLLRFGLADGRSLALRRARVCWRKGRARPTLHAGVHERLSGAFELLVKVYPEGALSKHLATIPIGSSVNFKHIPKNVKDPVPVPRDAHRDDRRRLGGVRPSCRPSTRSSARPRTKRR